MDNRTNNFDRKGVVYSLAFYPVYFCVLRYATQRAPVCPMKAIQKDSTTWSPREVFLLGDQQTFYGIGGFVTAAQ